MIPSQVLFRFTSILVGLAVLMGCGSSSTEQTESTIAQTADSTNMETPIALDRFEDSILQFDSLDQANGITQGGILFTGSSSIRMWETLKEDMEGYPVLNRGFGGSTLPEVAYYAERIIFPHQPKLIILYCGENDISEGAEATEVLQSFKVLMARIRVHLPNTHIAFVSMKPSSARWSIWSAFQKGNELIEAYIDQYPTLHYLDSGAAMLKAGGMIDSTIYIEDGLHMNAKGYAQWTAMIRPFIEQTYPKLNQ